MINLHNITKQYITMKNGEKESVSILDNINYKIYPEKMNVIVGKSGVGKTTLLQIIGLLDKPTDGEYWWNDKKINFKRDSKLADIRNKKIGFIFQDYELINKSDRICAIPNWKTYKYLSLLLYIIENVSLFS